MTLAMRGKSAAHSATSETVGAPVGMTAQLVLNGGVKQSGLVSPTAPEIYESVLASLAKNGIEMQETITESKLE